MNTEFLILVAAPLCVYLIILLYSLQDIEPSDAPATPQSAHISEPAPEVDAPASQIHQIISATVSQNQTTAEPFPDALLPVAVTADVMQEAFTTPAAPPPLTIDTSAAAPAVENAPVLEAKPILAPDAAEQNTPAIVIDAASIPPRATDSAAGDETIITEPASVAPVQNSDADETPEEEMPDGPLELPEKGSPKFVFDYRGRLWVEKKNKGFFKQLRRPQLPPDDPNAR